VLAGTAEPKRETPFKLADSSLMASKLNALNAMAACVTVDGEAGLELHESVNSPATLLEKGVRARLFVDPLFAYAKLLVALSATMATAVI
jgi:hypothetical protein